MFTVEEHPITKEVSLFNELSAMEHEQVVFCHDKATGLKAIIGIHNTVLGPALGGTRIWNYATEAEAINDVLRLSRGMTFKNAISGLNLGGGKAVIIGDAKTIKSEALLRRFGKFVNSLSGKYITAEDVGVSTRDMEYVAMETKHVSGMPESMGGGGDPSPFTAYGVYLGMKAAAKKAYGSDSLAGKTIAVQGVGHVGDYLVERLKKENANIVISDFYEDRLNEVAKKYGVKAVGLDEIYDVKMDIYAPCALGATVNADTLSRLSCKVIAGCANNQLKDEKIDGEALTRKGIVYAPDFLINAGGVINVYQEVVGNYNRDRAFAHVEKIYDFTLDIFNKADADGITTQEAAVRMAKERIESIGKVRLGL
jgi:leucine dehydrogenase